MPWRTFLQAAATHIPSAIVWCALGHHPLCDPVGQLGAVGQLGGRVICLGKNGSNDSNDSYSRSYRHGTIPLKHGNGAMAASNFGGSHGSMMTSIPLDSPTFGCPPRLAWSSNPKNVFPNVMRLQNPTKISSICQDSRTFPIPFPFMFFSGFTSI